MADSTKPAVIAPVDMSTPSLARDLLITATQAYKLYPANCSGAVNWVIVNMVDPKMPPLLANDLMAYFAKPANGWRQVAGVPEASELANRCIVVVAGKAEPGAHGHVVIVLPGPWKPAGGFTSNGKIMHRYGSFPPAMSTAWSSPGTTPWPGAVSNGDKTVRDPWSTPDWIKVTFWTKR
jgi:hypothetical protein